MAWLPGFFGPLESMDKSFFSKIFLFYLSILVFLIQSVQGKKAFKKGNDTFFRPSRCIARPRSHRVWVGARLCKCLRSPGIDSGWLGIDS
jgi:hypothetical protein